MKVGQARSRFPQLPGCLRHCLLEWAGFVIHSVTIDVKPMTILAGNLGVVRGSGFLTRCGAVSAAKFVHCVVFVLLVLGLAGPDSVGWAQSGVKQSGSLRNSPADIVKRYVRLDQKGARLDAMAFDVLAPYIDWGKEPVWDHVVVIKDANVAEDYRKWEIIDNLEVIIPVTFQVRGAVDLKTAAFTPDDTTEEVRFRVKAVRNSWRIVEPMIPPHIGVTRLVNFAREAGLQEKDGAQRGALTALEGSLRKAK